jgi:hypothetical protein
VTRHPTAEWLARQITEAFPWTSAPAYLVRDNDGAFGCIEQSNGPVSLSPFRSWPDCIINTSGYDFRKGQAHV